jgi:hypothetical protein
MCSLDEALRRRLSKGIPELFDDLALCDDVVTTGTLAHLVALGETVADEGDMLLFASIMTRLTKHEKYLFQ